MYARKWKIWLVANVGKKKFLSFNIFLMTK